MKKQILRIAVGGLLLLQGCSTFSGPGISVASQPKAVSAPTDTSLSNLLQGDAISKEEQQLREVMRRPTQLKFPVKVGVLMFYYRSALENDDQKIMLDKAGAELKQSGLVSDLILIPNSLIRTDTNIDTIRQLGSRFQVDILLLATGATDFRKAANQPLTFAEQFSDKAYWESLSKLDVLALDIYSGTFLRTFTIATRIAPRALDRADSNYSNTVYDLKKQSELNAWQQLQTEFVTALQKIKDTPAPAPTATPSPTPLPTATPSPTPSGGKP